MRQQREGRPSSSNGLRSSNAITSVLRWGEDVREAAPSPNLTPAGTKADVDPLTPTTMPGMRATLDWGDGGAASNTGTVNGSGAELIPSSAPHHPVAKFADFVPAGGRSGLVSADDGVGSGGRRGSVGKVMGLAGGAARRAICWEQEGSEQENEKRGLPQKLEHDCADGPALNNAEGDAHTVRTAFCREHETSWGGPPANACAIFWATESGWILFVKGPYESNDHVMPPVRASGRLRVSHAVWKPDSISTADICGERKLVGVSEEVS